MFGYSFFISYFITQSYNNKGAIQNGEIIIWYLLYILTSVCALLTPNTGKICFFMLFTWKMKKTQKKQDYLSNIG